MLFIWTFYKEVLIDDSGCENSQILGNHDLFGHPTMMIDRQSQFIYFGIWNLWQAVCNGNRKINRSHGKRLSLLFLSLTSFNHKLFLSSDNNRVSKSAYDSPFQLWNKGCHILLILYIARLRYNKRGMIQIFESSQN